MTSLYTVDIKPDSDRFGQPIKIRFTITFNQPFTGRVALNMQLPKDVELLGVISTDIVSVSGEPTESSSKFPIFLYVSNIPSIHYEFSVIFQNVRSINEVIYAINTINTIIGNSSIATSTGGFIIYRTPGQTVDLNPPFMSNPNRLANNLLSTTLTSPVPERFSIIVQNVANENVNTTLSFYPDGINKQGFPPGFEPSTEHGWTRDPDNGRVFQEVALSANMGEKLGFFLNAMVAPGTVFNPTVSLVGNYSDGTPIETLAQTTPVLF